MQPLAPRLPAIARPPTLACLPAIACLLAAFPGCAVPVAQYPAAQHPVGEYVVGEYVVGEQPYVDYEAHGFAPGGAGAPYVIEDAAPPAGPASILYPNPAPLPAGNRDLLWDQVVDVVDDYFRIDREQRVRLVGNVLTEGRIDTFPRGGATLLEPCRRDSVGYFNRLESTLQSIRRTALVRVIPSGDAYLVDVVVQKELEDVSRPEHSTAGAATLRHDTGRLRRRQRLESGTTHLGWIPQGRDPALEQQILADIYQRLTEVGPVR